MERERLDFTRGSQAYNFSGSTLTLGGDGITQSAATGAVTLANTINFNATTTISNTADLTLSGAINTSGTVSKTGTGTLYPTADNSSKTLNLTVSQGTLSVASASALGDRNGYFTLNGGTLQTTASMDLAKYFIYATANSTINTAAATTFTISSTISGSSSLAKTGVGTLVLSANNYTFGGDTIGNAAHLGSDNLAFNGGTLASTDTLTLSNAITLAAAARTHAVPLARLSFKGALATLRHWTPPFAVCAGSPSLVRRRFDQLLLALAADRLPLRPGRSEPRVIKRRPQSYPLLNRPRHLLRFSRSKNLKSNDTPS